MGVQKSKEIKTLDNYAFIDSQNLNLGTLHAGWKIDYLKFRNYLRTKYLVKKAYLFIGFIGKNASLYKHLQECGFILVFKNVMEIKRNGKTTYKGNVDAELVLHTMIQYKKYRKAVIVSGDGDFYCLVEYLSSKDKLAKVIVPNQTYSSLLRKYSNHIFTLSQVKHKLKVETKK